MKKKAIATLLLGFLLALLLLANIHYAYAVQKGDSFSYSETVTVNNGQGSYTGYSDKTLVTGTEQVNSVNGNSVSSHYHFSYQYSNNQGNYSTSSSSGNYTWSSKNFTYINGTDNQVGYSKPIYVWFAMNTSIPVGGTFYVLNTQFTVLSKNYSFQLPTKEYVQTIQTKGTGQYQRNDSYGIFTASYTWYEYFDPTSGYIVGYNYLEQDNGKYQGQVGSFTYTDDLYVTSTSYKLVPASPPATSATTLSTATNIDQNLAGLPIAYLAVILGLVLIILVGVYAATRRRRRGSLPQHPYPPTTPPPTPLETKVNLGSQPPEQVVVREVAKVNCKFCGTLIPSTAGTCPYCGAPRQ